MKRVHLAVWMHLCSTVALAHETHSTLQPQLRRVAAFAEVQKLVPMSAIWMYAFLTEIPIAPKIASATL